MSDWQQYFPTYHFDESKNRDIALEEYRACCKILESEERIFDNLVKYIIAFGTILVSLITGLNDKLMDFFKNYESSHIYWLMIILIFLFFLFMTKNFAERQKSIVFAKRKIVMLRRMLGVDYGTQEFLFKKGMLEGASMPFSIKLDFSYLFLPILVLNAISVFFIVSNLCENIYCIFTLVVVLSIVLLYLYIYWILDLNETMVLIIFRKIFKMFGLEFVDNFEDVLYRAKLAVYETKRHKVNLKILKEILVAVEDKNFYKHKGIDYRAMARAILSQFRKIPLIRNIDYIKKRPYSGGSTITQQLFRTLFISNLGEKKFRRKIAEILLARLWLNKQLSKDEQLEIYLSQVRFDRGIYGILSAMKHYYGKIIVNPTKAQSFFLIERVSIVSKKMFPKIVDTIARLQKANTLDKNDITDIIKYYELIIKEQKIIKDKNSDEILNKLTKISAYNI